LNTLQFVSLTRTGGGVSKPSFQHANIRIKKDRFLRLLVALKTLYPSLTVGEADFKRKAKLFANPYISYAL
jgi:hypothetical protein